MINQARRKSRGDQKRDLALLESQSNAWREQISEKTAEIQEKDKRIQVCPILSQWALLKLVFTSL